MSVPPSLASSNSAGHGDQLVEVLDPALVLRVGADRVQLGEVAGAVEDALQHGGRAGAGLDQLAQLVHQLAANPGPP